MPIKIFVAKRHICWDALDELVQWLHLTDRLQSCIDT